MSVDKEISEAEILHVIVAAPSQKTESLPCVGREHWRDEWNLRFVETHCEVIKLGMFFEQIDHSPPEARLLKLYVTAGRRHDDCFLRNVKVLSGMCGDTIALWQFQLHVQQRTIKWTIN